MNAACHSIEEKIDFTGLIAPEDVIGFCYPIYGSRLPRLMREFVSMNEKSLKGKKLIIFCTQMIFSGDGSRVLTDLLPRDHAQVIYAEHFLMPNNVCNLFFLPVPGDKTIDWYLAKSQKKMQAVCENISNGKVRKRGFNPGSRALGLVQGVFLPGLEERAKKKVWISDDCDLCGLCVTICPMENLAVESGKIVTSDNCMMCYRCINKCPKKALKVFLKGRVKKQYAGV